MLCKKMNYVDLDNFQWMFNRSKPTGKFNPKQWNDENLINS